MELVYLWVEDYKNIKKQGFNFSPRFRCEYDGETLTIKENDDYIDGFFGDNINVTAIVGKNGSGKSSILKLIRLIITSTIKDGSFLIFYDEKRNKILSIYTKNKIIFKVESECELEQDDILSNYVIFPMFDYSLSYNDTYSEHRASPIYPKNLSRRTPFSDEMIENYKNIIQNYHDLKKRMQLDKFKDFFQPYKLSVIFDLSKLSPYSSGSCELRDEKQREYDSLCTELKKTKDILDFLQKIEEIHTLIIDGGSYSNDDSRAMGLNGCADGSFGYISKQLGDILDIPTEPENSIGNIWGNIGQNPPEDLIKLNKIDEICKTGSMDKYQIFEFHIDDLDKKHIKEILYSFFSHNYFIVELQDKNNKKLSDLSFGEQQLLFILNQIYSLGIELDQDLYDDISPKEITESGHDLNKIDRFYQIEYVMLFDEIDIGFHPDWQRKIIKYMIDFLQATTDNKKYHLIFTTHSPFLISDVPKNNIVFLNDEELSVETFGANIHTLLSDSFFMEDGLMGEFAKSKINEIIDFHKKVESKDADIEALKKEYKEKRDKFYQTQSIIGEEYLKQILENHLLEIDKLLLGKDKAKEKLKERLEKQLRELDE
jgi:energy-coupling factor transporter ATP-binding protein EcfA2